MVEICPVCGLPKEICVCGTITREQQRVTVRCEMRRWGKAVTVIEGASGKAKDLKKIAKRLKTLCACGGTAKNNQIILQGDHREKVKQYLTQLGFQEGNIEIH